MATKAVNRGKAAPARKPAPAPAARKPATKAPAPDVRHNPTPRNAVATREKKTTAVANADINSMMEEDEGSGLSSDINDNLVPLIYILQPLSPQVLKNKEQYIEGAEPGHLWLRNSQDPIHEDFWFQPCHFSKDWVEWVPRKAGGGLAGRYPEKPSNAVAYRDPERPNAQRWKMPNGNDIVETRYYAGYVLLDAGPLPYIIALSSTGHTFGKDLMVQLNQRRTARGGKAPMFANKVLLGTTMRANSAGEWYMWNIEAIEFVEDVEQYIAGKNLQTSFASGEKQVDLSGGMDTGVDAGDGDRM